MVIVNWLIKATRRLVSRLIVASTSHWLPFTHEHHIWDVEKVKNLIASYDEPVTFSAVTQGILQNSWTYLMASLSSTLIWTP